MMDACAFRRMGAVIRKEDLSVMDIVARDIDDEPVDPVSAYRIGIQKNQGIIIMIAIRFESHLGRRGGLRRG